MQFIGFLLLFNALRIDMENHLMKKKKLKNNMRKC